MILVAALAGIILAAAAPHGALADPTNDRERQSQTDQVVNETYAAVRQAEPYVDAVALPILHCPDLCYRSVRAADDIVLAPLVERHRSTSLYDGTNVSDRSWTGMTTIAGALVEEESIDDTTRSNTAGPTSSTRYEAADRSVSLLTSPFSAGAGESESRSTTLEDGTAREEGGQHAGAGAGTLGTPAGGGASLAAGHSHSTYQNQTTSAVSSDSGGAFGLALDAPNGNRSSSFAGIDLASDHPAKTTLVRVQYSTPVADPGEQLVELPFVLP